MITVGNKSRSSRAYSVGAATVYFVNSSRRLVMDPVRQGNYQILLEVSALPDMPISEVMTPQEPTSQVINQLLAQLDLAARLTDHVDIEYEPSDDESRQWSSEALHALFD